MGIGERLLGGDRDGDREIPGLLVFLLGLPTAGRRSSDLAARLGGGEWEHERESGVRRRGGGEREREGV